MRPPEGDLTSGKRERHSASASSKRFVQGFKKILWQPWEIWEERRVSAANGALIYMSTLSSDIDESPKPYSATSLALPRRSSQAAVRSLPCNPWRLDVLPSLVSGKACVITVE
jgi:hypothetical protein